VHSVPSVTADFMATKPRDFKAEYARRIASAQARGKTRQAARGHKHQEHIARREREIEQNEGVSNSQVRSIRNFYSRWLGHSKKDIPDQEQMIDFAREVGYPQFVEYRKTWDAARRVYLRELSKGTYSSRGLDYLEMLTDQAGVRGQDDDIKWLYYH
jgi:hypothetical protein